MYDFRKDLSLIVDNIEPTKQGLAAIQAAIRLAEQNFTAEKPSSKEQKSILPDNKQVLTPMISLPKSRKADNEAVPMSDSLDSPKTEKEVHFVMSGDAEKSDIDPSKAGMNLNQHNAVQKYKSINEQLYNAIRDWINDSTKKPDFSALHHDLENQHNSISADDLDQTNAYYLMLKQTLNYAQKLFNLYDEKTDKQQKEINSLSKQTESLVKGFLDYLNGVHQDEFISLLSKVRTEKKPSLLSESTLAIMNNYVEDGKESSKADTESSKQDESAVMAKFFDDMKQKMGAPKTKAKTFELQPKEYVVKRRLSGAQLMDEFDEQAFYVNEYQSHMLNLQTGDVVKVNGEPYQSDSAFKIKKIVGHLDNVWDTPHIIEFKQAIVEKKNGDLVINHNVNGDSLIFNGEPMEYLIDNSTQSTPLAEGDIVDLVWYGVAKVPNPQRAITVRWVYPTTSQATKSSSAAGSKHVKKAQIKSKRKLNALKKQLDEEIQAKSIERFKKRLMTVENNTGKAMTIDLKGKKIGVAVGGGQNWEIIKNAILLLNGEPRLINAFSGKRKTIRKVVKGLDAVVLVQSYANHASSWQITDACKEFNVKFAISPKLATNSILQAIYRALDNRPVFLPGGQVIDYDNQDHDEEN
ncbi:hypothetical protein [Limosilactobacillus allomucosae]|uniref:hypothetical protein n=1 Tax=Limosilactobacillus allomucosae TaxID=3142938 RepID=UPI003265B376